MIRALYVLSGNVAAGEGRHTSREYTNVRIDLAESIAGALELLERNDYDVVISGESIREDERIILFREITGKQRNIPILIFFRDGVRSGKYSATEDVVSSCTLQSGEAEDPVSALVAAIREADRTFLSGRT